MKVVGNPLVKDLVTSGSRRGGKKRIRKLFSRLSCKFRKIPEENPEDSNSS